MNMENVPQENTPNPLKSEHLRKGIQPIMVCVGSHETIDATAFTDPSSVHNIDYYSSIDDLDRKGFSNAGNKTYVISSVDDMNKMSTSFFNCTGLIICGIDKHSGKNISFVAHQDPTRFLFESKEKYIEDLNKKLDEIKRRCEDRTFDAVIVGGNYLFEKRYQENYLNSIELISKEVQSKLGFEPVVVGGPKTWTGNGRGDAIFYSNDKRRLYFMREEEVKFLKEFTNSNMKEEAKKWRKNPFK